MKSTCFSDRNYVNKLRCVSELTTIAGAFLSLAETENFILYSVFMVLFEKLFLQT
jgi:hypothetical protein